MLGVAADFPLQIAVTGDTVRVPGEAEKFSAGGACAGSKRLKLAPLTSPNLASAGILQKMRILSNRPPREVDEPRSPGPRNASGEGERKMSGGRSGWLRDLHATAFSFAGGDEVLGNE